MRLTRRIFARLKRGGNLINIIGLSIGIAASVIILLYVKYEQSFDTYNEQFKNIYRIRTIIQREGGESLDGIITPPAFARTVKKECPEIKEILRFFVPGEQVFKIDEREFEEDKISYVDSSFFNVFSVPLILGNKMTCLRLPNTAVLSETTAKKYFGNENPMGKIIYLQKEAITVTGVYKDMPMNSHFKFDVLLSYYTPNWLNKSSDNSWDVFFVKTYFTVNGNIDIASLEKKITAIYDKNLPANSGKRVAIIQSLKDIHLYSNSRAEFEQNGNGKINVVLTIVAFLILIIAWINYINLTTANSLSRAKEVGVRKVVGCYKFQLVKKFLLESLMLNSLSILLAIVLVFFSKQYFSELLGVSLSYKYWNIGFIILLIFVFICGTIISALYPSLVLSSFNPVEVLKGKLGISTGGIGIRKVLLCFQFFISAALIFLTIVVYHQTNYLLNSDLGINIKNTLVIKGSDLPGNDSIIASKIVDFKEELLTYPEIHSASSSNCLPANIDFVDPVWSDKQYEKDKQLFMIVNADYNYITGLGVRIIAGRNYSKDFPSDKEAVIISESGIKQLGFSDADEALKHKVNFQNTNNRGLEIIGVINDIKMASLQKRNFPVIMLLRPAQKRFFAVKVNGELNQTSIEKIQTVWKKYFNDELFRYFILEESYNKLYKNEIQNSRILSLFSILAILVSIIGLWGLAYFSIKQRIKEIGVRKVLGFKVFDIVKLINSDFLKLVGIACCVAIPLAWFLSVKWLENYANRIEIQWWYFVIPVLAVSLITIATISFYTIKAAMSNPVMTLRNE